MKCIRISLLLSSLAFTSNTYSSELVLSETSIGQLKLTSETIVSKSKLQKLFPNHVVTHQIGQGDSPDFHYFKLLDKKSNLIFTISSFIEENDSPDDKEVKISVLEIHSESVKDQYGINIGLKYRDITKKRKTGLKFGANHYDYCVGSRNIWYSLSEELVNKKYDYVNPTQASIKDIENVNPKIISISWPRPRW